MTQTEPLTWPVALAEIPPSGIRASRRLSKRECVALASRAGIEAVDSLAATVEIRPWADGVEVDMSFVADVVQSCVVTLEPVRGHIEERFVRRYLPGLDLDVEGEVQVAPGEEDPPEPLVGDTLDLAAPLTEQLILSLDPYPRAPGAVLPDAAAGMPDKTSPFAVLESLKRKN